MGESVPAIRAQAMELVSVFDVECHPRNPRRGDVEAIAESIAANGYVMPVLVQRSTGFVIAGNHRLKAARQVGLQAIPVIWTDMDDAEALRYMVGDNRYAELGTWDDMALLAVLDDFDPAELLGSGYDEADREFLRAALEPPPPPEPGVPDGPSDEVTIKVGMWSFKVDRGRWEAFEASVTASAGTGHDQAVDEICERLGL